MKGVFFRWLNACLFVGVLTSACESAYNGDFPEGQKLPVVHSLLAADSTFKLGLSWPVSPSSTNDFPVIDDARVVLWEDSVLLGLATSLGDGQYSLDSVLKAGSRYRVDVSIPSLGTITANTIIPFDPAVELNYEKIKGDFGGIDNYQLQLGRPDLHASGIWLFVTERNVDESLNEQPMMLYSNSALCDNFNRSLNFDAQGGYSFSYDYFIRLSTSLLGFDVNRIDLASWVSMKKSQFAVVTASCDYDQYFRAAFLQKYWSPSSDLPFTYQPITIYSNVNGGYGIFAGYNVAAYHFN
ncbi:MAG: DUF4249 family protein [Marinilabiliaceae bacterium]|nr:DUF4249 family protein [Marinilabiliaceae bacterium]